MNDRQKLLELVYDCIERGNAQLMEYEDHHMAAYYFATARQLHDSYLARKAASAGESWTT